jgi:hypothetical protein
MAVAAPTHKTQHTGDAILDRIQNNVSDLYVFVRSLLWVRQRAYVALGTDATTTSATYVTLLETTITTVLERGYLLMTMTASGAQITNNAVNRMRFVLDGVPQKGCYTVTTANQTWSMALIVRASVVRGSHTVLLQWNTDAGTMRISGLSLPEEHASVHLQEEAA